MNAGSCPSPLVRAARICLAFVGVFATTAAVRRAAAGYERSLRDIDGEMLVALRADVEQTWPSVDVEQLTSTALDAREDLESRRRRGTRRIGDGAHSRQLRDTPRLGDLSVELPSMGMAGT